MILFYTVGYTAKTVLNPLNEPLTYGPMKGMSYISCFVSSNRTQPKYLNNQIKCVNLNPSKKEKGVSSNPKLP